jgi:hypothetical protein
VKWSQRIEERDLHFQRKKGKIFHNEGFICIKVDEPKIRNSTSFRGLQSTCKEKEIREERKKKQQTNEPWRYQSNN